jgi:DMSO/TMAO reductase YedYZ heme-binding membrane subunit
LEQAALRKHPSAEPTPPDYSTPIGMRREEFRAMGTTISLLLPESQAALGAQIVHSLFSEWEQALSRFLPESELSQLNQQAGTPVVVSELHNFLTLLSTIFLVVHVLAVWVDPFTHFGWNEILIPLASSYRPAWMALGIVGLYLGIAIGISTWLRPHIGYNWWRRLHVLTLGIFALAAIHGTGTGSDTQTWWALGIYLVSIILVSSLLYRRAFSMKGKRKHSPARPATLATRVNAAPQSSSRALNGARVVATPMAEQKRAESARVK